jgi:hypothetical protein
MSGFALAIPCWCSLVLSSWLPLTGFTDDPCADSGSAGTALYHYRRRAESARIVVALWESHKPEPRLRALFGRPVTSQAPYHIFASHFKGGSG